MLSVLFAAEAGYTTKENSDKEKSFCWGKLPFCWCKLIFCQQKIEKGLLRVDIFLPSQKNLNCMGWWFNFGQWWDDCNINIYTHRTFLNINIFLVTFAYFCITYYIKTIFLVYLVSKCNTLQIYFINSNMLNWNSICCKNALYYDSQLETLALIPTNW